MTFWCIHGRKIKSNHHIYGFIFSLLLLLVVITFGIYSFGNFGIHITFWFAVTMLYNRSLILTSSFLKPFNLWSKHFPFSQTYLILQPIIFSVARGVVNCFTKHMYGNQISAHCFCQLISTPMGWGDGFCFPVSSTHVCPMSPCSVFAQLKILPLL